MIYHQPQLGPVSVTVGPDSGLAKGVVPGGPHQPETKPPSPYLGSAQEEATNNATN